MTSLIAEKVRNNDGLFFKKFTLAREKMERFLVQNKSLITLLLTNMSKGQRTTKMKDLFNFLVEEGCVGKEVTAEEAIAQLGLRGRFLEVDSVQVSTAISDDTKSTLFVKDAITRALPCPLCRGLLDPTKSVSYDHITPIRDGGTGDVKNVQLVHPFCNSSEIGKEAKARM